MHNKIINKDCLEGIWSLPDESIDMIVTSPPYFVGKEYDEGADYDEDDVLEEYNKFSKWLTTVFQCCNKILKPGGKIAINIDDRHVGLGTAGKNVVCPTHARLISNLEYLYDYKEMILWKKIRKMSTSGGSSRLLGSYGRFGSPGEIPILQEVEYILLFRKPGKREGITDEMRKESALTPEEFATYGRQIWEVKPEQNRIHPAPFPVEIPYRLIKLFTFKGDLILDPFMGSGSTAIAALETGRKYLGFDLEKEYCDMANERIDSFLSGAQDLTYLKTNAMFVRKKTKKNKSSFIF